MVRKNEKRWKIQKCPLYYMEYGKKTESHGNEKHPLDELKTDEITEKHEKLEVTLQDLEYGQKTENHGN